MAGSRTPGSVCATNKSGKLDQGTTCLQKTPRPGPLGMMTGFARGFASGVAGQGKSLLLTIINLLPLKPDSPYSTALLKHYVESSGTTYTLQEIPPEWQDWIVAATKGKSGSYKDLNPYNSGLYDLRNSLGHFDVQVTAGGGKTTYEIHDLYQFGYTQNDKNQKGRHGFPVGELDETTFNMITYLLPSDEYENPGGFKERWELKRIGKETILFIPQKFLADQGKPFEVKGSFTR